MKKLFIFLFVFMMFFSFSFQVFARDDKGGNESKCTEDGCTLGNPLGVDSVPALVGQIIKALLGISGSLALVMFIYGGFTWMTAAGNSEGIDKGKKVITWAVVGLIIIFSAYGLVKLIFTSLGVTGV